MYKCVGTRFNVLGDWDSVFHVYKYRFVEIDGYITEGLKIAKEGWSKEKFRIGKGLCRIGNF